MSPDHWNFFTYTFNFTSIKFPMFRRLLLKHDSPLLLLQVAIIITVSFLFSYVSVYCKFVSFSLEGVSFSILGWEEVSFFNCLWCGYTALYKVSLMMNISVVSNSLPLQNGNCNELPSTWILGLFSRFVGSHWIIFSTYTQIWPDQFGLCLLLLLNFQLLLLLSPSIPASSPHSLCICSELRNSILCIRRAE